MRHLPRKSAKILVPLLCGLLLFPPQLLAAGPVASGATNTTVSTAGNGVPVVNIAAPNASGLSHNAYTSYNVDAQGLVLNNGNTSQSHRQSQLAGVVAANPNLGAGPQASIILNEVTGGGRSTLAGFTEVLGGKADVIVANPFGITCNGCGFINTDRVSLVTGAPNFGGANLSFDVRSGDILITGTGLNASAQNVFDLVSRRIAIGGQVNANTLNAVAGANNWTHATGAASAIASDGSAAPAYAIDASALGAMYAGRIALKSTEAGVGVRMQNQAAATADDFTITSAGRIEVTGKLSAARDLAVTSTATGADAISATDANLTAARDLALNASLGGATLTGGGIVAGRQLAYNLGGLTDTASATAGITDANKRYGATAALAGTGAWSINGVNYGAGSALGLSAQSLTLGNTAETTFYSGGSMNLSAVDALTLGNAGLQSVGGMTLAATDPTAGLLTIGSLARAKSTGGNMYLNAGKRTGNAGTLTTATGDIVIRTGLNGGGYGLQNNGSIWAGGLLDIADRNGAGTQQVEFSGSAKVGGRTVKVSALRLDMLGTAALTSTGDMVLLLESGSVETGAKVLAVTGGVGTLAIQAASASEWQGFYNYGLVHSGQDLDASTMGIGAQPDSSGTVSAVRDLKLMGFDSMAGNYIAGNNISIAGASILRPNADGSPNAMFSAGNDINITAYRLRNWSIMNAGHDINITTSHFFSNSIGDSGSSNTLYIDYLGGSWQVVKNTNYVPQIIAGNAITINTGTSQSQNVGLISAPTVNVGGSGLLNGGTIRGSSVNITGGGVTNVGVGTSTPGAATGASIAPVPVPGGVSFSGVTITLPTTPNGLFVPAQSSTSGYLVESNPLYTNIDNFLGSDYLAQKYSFKADDVVKRLGDAAYETYLVRQQLVSLTGSNMVVAGAATEKAQMQALMDSAGAQAKRLGLSYGKALSAAQQAGLTSDMVWMVETTVNGQKVLAPVVYLAASTKELFNNSAGGGLIAGDAVNANVATLTNSGTIRGGTVNIAATGDVQNIGGSITGKDVSVASTGGSVINTAAVSEQVIQRGDGHIDLKTTVGKAGSISGGKVDIAAAKNVENVGGSIKGGEVSVSAGGDVVNSALVATNVSGSSYRETVAATGSIESAGSLKVQAGRDVRNLGGQMGAGGDASISAGRDATFDTVALTNRDSATSSTKSFVKNEDKRTTTTTVTQVKGGVGAGGALSIASGGDVTLAATDVSAGKSLTVDAGGDLNILARSNAVQTVTESNSSGAGVGGGLLGTEKKTTDQFASRAVGSSLTTVKVGGGEAALTNQKGSLSGGDVSLSAGKTATLEGAKVNSAGAVNIAATGVQVLEARDVDRTTTHTESTSYLSVSGGDGDKSASASKAGIKSDGAVKAGASASSAKDAGGVDFVKTTTTDTFDESTRAVGTQIAAAGGLNITARKDATLRGADVKAGGDVNLSGENVNVLAAQDTRVSTSTTSTTKVGLYASTTNAADAKAGAGAAAAAGIGNATASAGATSTANAASTSSIDVMRTQTTKTATVDITNQGTTLASGGVLNIKSGNALTVQGSDLSGEKGVDLHAKDMRFLAAQDTHDSSTSTTKTSAGLYLDGTANAAAGASAGANAGLGANAGTKAEAGAKTVASLGVQGKNVTSSASEGSSTARVSTISSGSGGITRTAQNGITDVGTDITAAGDFSQSAKTITSLAAQNTSYSSGESTTNTAKLGVYGKAEASAGAEAGANAGLGLNGKPSAQAGAGAETKAKVGAGVNASYNRDTLASGEQSSEAVVSSIKAGGRIVSASADKTSLEGTQISAGKGVDISAGSLDFTAAQNTSTTSSSAGNTNAQASAGVSRGTGKGVDVDLSGGTSSTEKRASSTTAVAGGIESGGDITIRTAGDTRLVGTGLAAVGDTTVAAGGNLAFEAARDTTSSSKTAYDASASVSTSDSKGAGGAASSGVSASASGGFSKSSSESSTARAGSINSGGALNLSAGKAASFEGTNMASGGDASIQAKDGVTISAAKSTSSSESYSGRVGLEAGSGSESSPKESSSSKSAGATVEASYTTAKETRAEAGSLVSGGNLKIVSGKDVNLEGTTLAADGKASVNAGGSVNFTAAESSSQSTGVGVTVSASAEKSTTTPASPAPGAGKAKNPGTGGTQGSDGSAQGNKDLATWQKGQASVIQELKDKQNAKTAAATGSSGSANSAGSGAAATAGEAAGPTAETKTSASVGVQVQNKSRTTQQAGGISAGAGGVEVVAKGGDVNLVGTRISTSGDADISAARDVNISAAKNTESGFSVAVAASASKTGETPAAGSKPASGASSAGSKGAGSTAAGSKAPASAGTGSAGAGGTGKPTAGAAPPVAGKTATGASSTGSGAPAASLPGSQAGAGSGPAPGQTNDKAGQGQSAQTGAAQTGAAQASGAQAADAKDPNTFGGSRTSSTNTDENKSGVYAGGTGGSRTTYDGAEIKTGGQVRISSGGKTRLTNTDIQAAEGQSINAAGGVERKTMQDSGVGMVNTDSGPAGTGQSVSKVPTATANPTTGVSAPTGMGGGASATDASQTGSTAPQSIKSAQGGSTATPGVKKN